ncbi:carbohydrate kinase family protein [Paludisphaera mucosa]|uniref:PfkB family carbohydrate kinase n=1 Tax=Paludisphaera mucosa TaxID=3030827 RepID=A0ABT6FE22_9BACT|nr:PfkB family carbohydrate kinase [Paludisphaera mucosa]MDG3005823.1 PfkB family carbohydrate kinase [Paludisphaera mucosa]
MLGRVRVFGPAYLDRVLRVDGPLTGPDSTAPLDQSVEGRVGFGGGDDLTLVAPDGASIAIALPDDWPGPRGVVELDGGLGGPAGSRIAVRSGAWADDLGGMGAGFAAALGAELVSALGPEDDPTSREVADLMERHGVAHRGLRTDRRADWTLLISSGGHGDKLAVGFRGCHAALEPAAFEPSLAESCDVRIVAALPNRLSVGILKAPGARLRVFAPAMRNMIDRIDPVLPLIGPVDLLCCNRGEWEALEDREEVAARLSILVVTDGAAGAWVRFTDPQGGARTVRIPAFPRARPPRDTNRAGEAFAAFLIASLLGEGWRPESCTVEVELVRAAMRRASAASALVLDRLEFGFPSAEKVDAALARGIVD